MCWNFPKWIFPKKNINRKNNEKNNKIRSVICSIYLNYYIRLTDYKKRTNFENIIIPILLKLINNENNV